ncbi:hypothetical protein DUI32_12995 [Enterococcus faecalis]|nr:hypothetical protein [Enterococcus faecalis]EGO9236942.1 hypothetical protein [Enterococcus faecalis]
MKGHFFLLCYLSPLKMMILFFKHLFKFVSTIQNHINDIIRKGANKGQLSRPYIDMDGTTLLLDEIMNAAPPVKDSILSNGLRWDVEGVFRDSQGTWELVIDNSTNTIVHFNFVK